jgi:hypothetical protein
MIKRADEHEALTRRRRGQPHQMLKSAASRFGQMPSTQSDEAQRKERQRQNERAYSARRIDRLPQPGIAFASASKRHRRQHRKLPLSNQRAMTVLLRNGSHVLTSPMKRRRRPPAGA